MRINTNVNAMVAYRNLNGINNSVSDSMSKLSTGFRINRAADDAAGLGIANKLRAEKNALGQASRNAEQANSVLQIAEGATSNVQKMLERMKELATQAGSDSVDAEGRARINSEFTALRDEITRTVDTTVFQGNTLLNGDFGSLGPQLLNADVTVATTAKVGEFKITVDSSAKTVKLDNGAGDVQTLDLDSTADDAKITYSGGKISLNFDTLGLTISTAAVNETDISSVKAALNGRTVDVDAKYTATGTTLAATTDMNGDSTTGDSLSNVGVVADSAKKGLYKFVASATYTNAIKLQFSSDGGATYNDVAGTDTNLDNVVGAAGTVTIGSVKFDISNTVTAGSLETFLTNKVVATETNTTLAADAVSGNPTGKQANFLVGSSGAYRSDDLISLKAMDLRTSTLGIDASTLTTATDARNALTAIDTAIGKVNSTLGDIGANQNRLENTMSNLKTTILNFTAAESVIRDLDMAEEMMKFSKNNILSQAATAMLAQANQSSQGILQLLRG